MLIARMTSDLTSAEIGHLKQTEEQGERDGEKKIRLTLRRSVRRVQIEKQLDGGQPSRTCGCHTDLCCKGGSAN